MVAREKNRKKDIDYHLTTKLDADTQGALERLRARWDGTVVVQAGFDPVSGALDDKALRQRIVEDEADASKLTGKRFASVVEWTKKLASALRSFLDLRRRVDEEHVELGRVAAAIGSLPRRPPAPQPGAAYRRDPSLDDSGGRQDGE